MRKYIAASLCMMVIAACAGGMKASRAPTTAPAETGAPPQQSSQGMPDVGSPSKKQLLDSYYSQVEQDRAEMKIGEPQVEAGTQPAPMSTPMPTSKTDPTCKHASSDTCETSCKLSDSICENTDKICKLSEELQPDEDASAKCAKATKTCKSSHEKCCGCML